MALIPFRRPPIPAPALQDGPCPVETMLNGYSVEVMPRTAAKIPDFRELLPRGTRVYIAHIDGTPFSDMLATASRLIAEGYQVMPHFPARIIPDEATLAHWIEAYAAAGVTQALVLGGGVATPAGAFDNSMQLLATGLFEQAGFDRLHVAGHPEGNRDIDPDGGAERVMKALHWKQDYAARTGVDMAIVTQFAFEAAPVLDWARGLRADGITLPIHLGIAGPAKLQTLIRFAIACGVGPSLKVLQKRALDVTKLMLPHDPSAMLGALARAEPGLIGQVHLFPLGGITATADFAMARGGAATRPARRKA